jgi:hypothetical protein
MSSTVSGELQTIISQLTQLEQQIDTINSKLGGTSLASSKAELLEMRVTMNEVLLMTNRVFFILRRAGLPDDFTQALATMQRMIALANNLYIAITAFNAAAGPMGWALAGLGIASSIVYATDMVGSYG